MEKVRAKFKVETKEPGDKGRVVLNAVYSSDPNHENKRFWSATPSGRIEMWIENPDAFAHFSAGEECYVDFIFPSKGE